MEWVEFSAPTIAEATDLAASELGLEVSALDVEVIEEPVAGLFGRVRGVARIRVRAAGTKPKGRTTKKTAGRAGQSSTEGPGATDAAPESSDGSAAPAKAAGRSRPKASGSALAAVAAVATAAPRTTGNRGTKPARQSSPAASRPPRDHDEPVDVSAVVASATRFLDGLLAAAGLDGDITHRVVDEQTVEVAVAGDGLGMLVGPKGQTLLAAQELLRTFVHHDTGGRSGRLMLDVAGYREKRRAALQTFTKQVAESVISTGERRVLEPMNAVDRKVVHDTVTTIGGVTSVSEGEDPQRYVVLLPA